MDLSKMSKLASHLQHRYISRVTYRPSSPMPKGPARGQLPPAPKEGEKLLYHVTRTKSQQLPVYTDVKNSNRKLTLVRKIAGNVNVLKNELQEYIGLANDRIAVNDLTNNIVIKVRDLSFLFVGTSSDRPPKGWYKSDVVRFLEAKRL